MQTEGLALPGIIERQESSAWESMLRHNLVAPLRTARVFIPLLRAKKGNRKKKEFHDVSLFFQLREKIEREIGLIQFNCFATFRDKLNIEIKS